MRVVLAHVFVIASLMQSPIGRQASESCVFPGTATTCEGPGNLRLLEWREPSADRPHELLLRKISGGQPIRVFRFNRSVHILWAPDGRTLAITDHTGSSDSSVWVLTVESPDRPVNVEARLVADLGRQPAIFRNGHRYFEAVRWLPDGDLLFRVRAHDAVPDKEYRGSFVYHADGGVTPAGRW
jgi:hypothetical protein